MRKLWAWGLEIFTKLQYLQAFKVVSFMKTYNEFCDIFSFERLELLHADLQNFLLD